MYLKYLKEEEGEKMILYLLVHSSVAAVAVAGAGQSQESRASFRSPVCVSGT